MTAPKIRPLLLLALLTPLALPVRPAIAGEAHDAATAGDIDALRRLAEEHVGELQREDETKRTPLDCAVEAGQIEAVFFLLNQFGDQKQAVHATCAAANHGQLELLETLFRAGVPPNIANENNTSLLMIAASSNHVDICRRLMELGLDPRSAKADGRSALHYAAQYGAPDSTRLLLDLGLFSDPLTERGWTPLHYAARNGYPDVVEILVQRGGADVSRRSRVDEEEGKIPSGGFMPLHLAAIGGHVECARKLLDGNANIDETDVRRYTPLALAIVKKHKDTVTFLLERGADPEIPDYEKETAVINAVRTGDVDIVRAVVAHDVDFTALNYQDVSATDIAIGRENTDVLGALVEAGASPNARYQGVTALALAIRAHDEPLVRLLLEKGADPSANGNFGSPALCEAASTGDLSLVKTLAALGADLHERAPCVRDGRTLAGRYHTPALGAARANNLPMLRYLAESGADLDLPGDEGLAPLHLAASHGNVPMMRLLLERGASIHGHDAGPPLATAVSHGHAHAVAYLLENGADPNATHPESGRPLLFEAATNDQADVVDRLLAGGADPRVRFKDTTPFLRAVMNGHAEVVRTMIRRGVDTSRSGNGNYAILGNAVRGGSADVFRQLVDSGASTQELRMRSSDGRTPLIDAAVRGHLELVKVIVAAGADVNETVNVDRISEFDGSDVRPEERNKTAIQIIEWHLGRDYMVLTTEYNRNFDRKEVAEYLRAHGAR